MRLLPADEPDSSWENHEPRFRVYLFTGPGPYSVTTCDVTEADVLETISWAQHEAGAHALFAVALVGETSPQGRTGRGLTWLVGMDANDNPTDAAQRRVLAHMHSRRGTHPVKTHDIDAG